MMRALVIASVWSALALVALTFARAAKRRARLDVGVDPFYEDEDPDDEITPEQAQVMWDRIVERLEWEQR